MDVELDAADIVVHSVSSEGPFCPGACNKASQVYSEYQISSLRVRPANKVPLERPSYTDVVK